MGHIDDTDNLFDPLVEVEFETYRVLVNRDAEALDLFGTHAVVCSERNVLMGCGDGIEAAEADALQDEAVL